MFRKERGFTLIELLIVIAVIGILAAAILPRFIAFDTMAKGGSTQGSLSSLRAAVTMFRAKEGAYPSTLAELIVSYNTTTDPDYGPYISSIPFAQVPSVSAATASGAETRAAPTGSAGWYWSTADKDVFLNATGSDDFDGSGTTDADEYYTNW